VGSWGEKSGGREGHGGVGSQGESKSANCVKERGSKKKRGKSDKAERTKFLPTL